MCGGVHQAEADAYWAFAAQLRRLGPHFDDPTVMHLRLEQLRTLLQFMTPRFYAELCRRNLVDLFFAYRWLLLDFKREFPFPAALRVWETLWSCHISADLALFCAVAIVEGYAKDALAAAGDNGLALEALAALARHMNARVVLRTLRAVSWTTSFSSSRAPDLYSLAVCVPCSGRDLRWPSARRAAPFTDRALRAI